MRSKLRRARGVFGWSCIAGLVALAGCASTPRPTSTHGGGSASSGAVLATGGRDGAELNPPPGLADVADAEPRVEPIRTGGPNKPYEVFGVAYVPWTQDRPFRERGLASWYGRKFHGRRTSSGETYDMYAMTAAHPTLPIPSYARVRNPANGREIVVRVNDRGPFHPGRIIDLSYTAALRLGVLRGVAPVEVERITFSDIRAGTWRRDRPPGDAQRLETASSAEALRRVDPDAGSGSTSSEPGAPGSRANARHASPGNPPDPSAETTASAIPDAASQVDLPLAAPAGSATRPVTGIAGTHSPASSPRDASATADPPAIAVGSNAAAVSTVAAASVTPALTTTPGAKTSEVPWTPARSSHAASAAAATAAAPSRPSGLWVQLGAFRQFDAAAAFQRRVSAELGWLSPMLTVFGESAIFRLQAGPYATQDEARGAAQSIRAALRLVPVIVERP